jgi:putative transposase
MKPGLTPALARVFKRLHYPFDVMLMCVRWYVAYGLSVRNLEEMMAERGIEVDHSTVHRWAIKERTRSVIRVSGISIPGVVAKSPPIE